MQQRTPGQSRNAQGPYPEGLRRDTRRVRVGWLARDVDLGALSEIFFVTAVASLLLTRSYLALTGFPQLGGAGLHIAHLLWGGLLMLIALVLLLAFMGRSLQRAAALLGGGGFGLLLDEVGKFVTSTNDYFFQPAVVIMYVVFVTLYLSFRTIERARRYSQRELLANAYDEAVDVVLHQDSTLHRERALHLLRESGATGPLARGLRDALAGLDEVAPLEPDRVSLWERAGWAVTRAYVRVMRSRWFSQALVLLVVGYAAVFLLLFGLELASATLATVGRFFTLTVFDLRGHRVIQLGLLASAVCSIAFIAVGLVTLRHSRLRAYQWLKRSTLVWILFGQIFLFYTQQFGALLELGLNLIALAGLDALIAAERRAQRLTDGREGPGHALAAPTDSAASS